jgi:hypothetical protein
MAQATLSDPPYSVALAAFRLLNSAHNKGGTALERLDHTARAVLGHLVRTGVQAGDLQASFHVKVQTLMKATGLSKPTLDRGISALVEAGMIERAQARRSKDRPSVAETKLTRSAVELLFSDQSQTSASDVSHAPSASKMRHIVSETNKSNHLYSSENPPARTRTHAHTGALTYASPRDGVADGSESGSGSGTHRAEEEGKDCLKRAAFVPRADLLFLIENWGINNNQIGLLMKLCKNAGIHLQKDFIPTFLTDIEMSNNKFAYALSLLSRPNIKVILEEKRQAIQRKKDEVIVAEKKIIHKNTISQFHGQVFCRPRNSQVKYEVQGDMAYTLGSKNGKALNSFEFMQLVENGELIKFVAPNAKEDCWYEDVTLRPGLELVRVDGSRYIISDNLDAISATGKIIKASLVQKFLKLGNLKLIEGVENEKAT